MAAVRCTWYEIVQALILIFTMLLMLSKYYEFLGDLSFIYETQVSLICVAVGVFSVLHGLYMMFKSFSETL
ncbi:hypothetical protein JW826_02565 [Candidatus Woesearchaeota archaeon]|nr:hypothetical protein [Candidatus Woesearchaeota archaeon]